MLSIHIASTKFSISCIYLFIIHMQPSCGEMGELSGSLLFAEPFAAPTHLSCRVLLFAFVSSRCIESFATPSPLSC